MGLLWGSNDNVNVPRDEMLPVMRAYFPNLQGYWVQRCGHNLNVEAVLSVARKIDDWLDPLKHGHAVPRQLTWRFVDALLFLTSKSLVEMTAIGRASEVEQYTSK